MNCIILNRKVAAKFSRDGINAYHAVLFHGNNVSPKSAHKNLGDKLERTLKLEKNVYDCRYIFQNERNLVIPESVKMKLQGLPNIDFYSVEFVKLFFFKYATGDQSFGPENYNDFDQWLESFKHDEGLRNEVEKFYELIIPSHDNIAEEFNTRVPVAFNLEGWREQTLDLCPEMLMKYPAIWSSKGIILREDVFSLIESFFCLTYFYKVKVAL